MGKTKSTGARHCNALVGCLRSKRLKDYSPKSQDGMAACSRLRSVALVDRGDIRQAIDRCGNIWASLPGAGYGQFEHEPDITVAKFKEKRAERSERLCMSQSHRDYLRSGYLSSSACHRLLIITVITPLPTGRRQKCQKAEAGERGSTDMQMRQRDVAALDAKYTKRVS